MDVMETTITKAPILRCWKCKDFLIYKQIVNGEIEVYHSFSCNAALMIKTASNSHPDGGPAEIAWEAAAPVSPEPADFEEIPFIVRPGEPTMGEPVCAKGDRPEDILDQAREVVRPIVEREKAGEWAGDVMDFRMKEKGMSRDETFEWLLSRHRKLLEMETRQAELIEKLREKWTEIDGAAQTYSLNPYADRYKSHALNMQRAGAMDMWRIVKEFVGGDS